jgi:hypothetical protein
MLDGRGKVRITDFGLASFADDDRKGEIAGTPHWEHLQSLRPQLIVFWYRSSPRPLVTPVQSRFGVAPIILAASSAEAITAASAASLEAGGSYLEIDPDGALNGLLVSPSGGDARTAANGPVDWTRLFVEARLDPAKFSPVETLPVVPVFADTRAAWAGPAPDGSGVPLRIEAAAVAGRPVYFRIIAPWTRPTESADVGIETMSAHAIASLDLSPFFGRTMVAGVLLFATPAILGFCISVAGRSLVGRRFDLTDASGASTHT